MGTKIKIMKLYAMIERIEKRILTLRKLKDSDINSSILTEIKILENHKLGLVKQIENLKFKNEMEAC